MKRVYLIAGAALAALAFSAWAAGSDEGAAATKIPTIELMQPGWVNQPTDAKDPFKKYLDETFKVDIKMNATAKFNEQILTRFAAGDPPDIISFNAGAVGESALRQLHTEGAVVQDWYAYRPKIPAWLKYMDDNAELYFTVDGKLICLCPQGEPAIWGFQIRKDWVSKLKLELPKTPEQLLDVARAFTRKDPDGNGKDDTWGFTSAGSGSSIGEIGNLRLMWGNPNFYVKDNKTTHFVVDGTEKAFLDYMRVVVKEGLIQPDWYTIKWMDRKAPLFQGKLGIAWYPGVLVTETVTEGKVPVDDAMKMWGYMPLPKGSAQGGKLSYPAFFNIMNTVSAKAEKDKAKFDRILALFEGVAFPNPGYYKLRWGVDIDKGRMVDIPGGGKVVLAGPDAQRYRGLTNFLGAADWGKWMSTRADFVVFTEGTSESDIPKYAYGEVELNNGALAEQKYAADPLFLKLDQTILGELNTLVAQFEYKYIMGQTDDYDGFQKSWLDAGGKKLLEDATAQFRKLGLIK